MVPLKNTAFRKLRESLIVDWQKPNEEIRGKSQPKHVGPPFYGNQTGKVCFCFAFNKEGKCKYFPCDTPISTNCAMVTPRAEMPILYPAN